MWVFFFVRSKIEHKKIKCFHYLTLFFFCAKELVDIETQKLNHEFISDNFFFLQENFVIVRCNKFTILWFPDKIYSVPQRAYFTSHQRNYQRDKEKCKF